MEKIIEWFLAYIKDGLEGQITIFVESHFLGEIW